MKKIKSVFAVFLIFVILLSNIAVNTQIVAKDIERKHYNHDFSKYNLAYFKKGKQQVYNNRWDFSRDEDLEDNKKIRLPTLNDENTLVNDSKEDIEVLKQESSVLIEDFATHEKINKDSYNEALSGLSENKKLVDRLFKFSDEEKKHIANLAGNPYIEYHMVESLNNPGKYNLLHFKTAEIRDGSLFFNPIKSDDLILKEIIINNEVNKVDEEIEEIDLSLMDLADSNDVRFIYQANSDFEQKDPKGSGLNMRQTQLNIFSKKNIMKSFDVNEEFDSSVLSFDMYSNFKSSFNLNLKHRDDFRSEEIFKRAINDLVAHYSNENGELDRKININNTPGEDTNIVMNINQSPHEVSFINDHRAVILNKKKNIVGYMDVEQIHFNLEDDDFLEKVIAVQKDFTNRATFNNVEFKEKVDLLERQLFNKHEYANKTNLIYNLPALNNYNIYRVNLLNSEDVDLKNIEFKNVIPPENKVAPDLKSNIQLHDRLSYNIRDRISGQMVYVDHDNNPLSYFTDPDSSLYLNRYYYDGDIIGDEYIPGESNANAMITYKIKDIGDGVERDIGSKILHTEYSTIGSYVNNMKNKGFNISEIRLLTDGKITSVFDREDMSSILRKNIKGANTDHVELIFDLLPENNGSHIYHIYDSNGLIDGSTLLSKEFVENDNVEINHILNEETHDISEILVNGQVLKDIENINELIKDSKNIILVKYKAKDICHIQKSNWTGDVSFEEDVNSVISVNEDRTLWSGHDYYTSVATYKNDHKSNAPLRFNLGINYREDSGMGFRLGYTDVNNPKTYFNQLNEDGSYSKDIVTIGENHFYFKSKDPENKDNGEFDLVNIETEEVEGYATLSVNKDKVDDYNAFLEYKFKNNFFSKKAAINYSMIDVVYWNKNNNDNNRIQVKSNIFHNIPLGPPGPQGFFGEGSGPRGNPIAQSLFSRSNLMELMPCGDPIDANGNKIFYGKPGSEGSSGESLPSMVFNHYLVHPDGSKELIHKSKEKGVKFTQDFTDKIYSPRNTIETQSFSGIVVDKVLEKHDGKTLSVIDFSSSVDDIINSNSKKNATFKINIVENFESVDEFFLEDALGIDFVDRYNAEYIHMFIPTPRLYDSLRYDELVDYFKDMKRKKQLMSVDVLYKYEDTTVPIDKKINLSVDKIDGQTGDAIFGAVFDLLDANTGEIIDRIMSNTSGKIVFKDIDSNKSYKLKEVKAPKGYKILENDIDVAFTQSEVLKGQKNIQIKNYRQAKAPDTGTFGKTPFALFSILFIGISILIKKNNIK